MSKDLWCPACLALRPSLPPPSEGSCAYCFNHLLAEGFRSNAAGEVWFADGGESTAQSVACPTDKEQ